MAYDCYKGELSYEWAIEPLGEIEEDEVVKIARDSPSKKEAWCSAHFGNQ